MSRSLALTGCFQALLLASIMTAQATNCAPPSNQQVIIYRAGSLTRAFKPLIEAFTCQTGIQVKDSAMGSVDAGRQITAGGEKCDLYAPADYLDIDLFHETGGLCRLQYCVRPRQNGAGVFRKRIGREKSATDRPGRQHTVSPAAFDPKGGPELVPDPHHVECRDRRRQLVSRSRRLSRSD